MRPILKRKGARPAGPRKNQWRGSRAGQVVSQHAEARRAKTVARWINLMRWGGLMAGAVLIGWVVMMGVKYSGPLLTRLLEIKTVTVEGVQHFNRREVVDLVALKPGTSLHQVVLPAIKHQVESHPWVKEAVVTRVPFHELRITVIEREPAAIIRTGSENFLSDEAGHVLARLGQIDDEALPMVTGVDPKGLLQGDGAVRQAIMSGIELAKLVGHTYAGRMQVNAANPSNLVASVRGVQFQFGDEAVGDQWERFQLVKPTLKTLNFDGHGRGANEVDLRYENRIIVRERG
jgi:cell division protein FtsQ